MFKFIRNLVRRFSGSYYQDNFRPVILVTGAGSGVGWALTKMLYNIERYRVVATAREKTVPVLKKEFIETDRFKIKALDVVSEESRKKLISEIEAEWGYVSILVNNAGISYRAVVEHMNEKDEIQQMATNYIGPMGLIRLVLPYMRKKGRGKIINVSSVSGMLAMPTMASYSASKHALEGASEALWYEAKPYGIDVCLIQPGFIRSKSFNNVYYTQESHPDKSFESDYREYYKNMIPFVGKLMSKSPTNPRSVAKKILWAIQKQNPPLWIPATLDAYFFYYVRRLLPRRFLHPILFYFLPNATKWADRYTKKRD